MRSIVLSACLLLACSPLAAQAYFHLDSTFNADGYVIPGYPGGERGNALALQSDQKIVVVGVTAAGGLVARFLPDGSPDLSFGAGGQVTIQFAGQNNFLNAVAIQPSDGKIVLAGGTVSSVGVARLLPGGQLDPSFGAGGIATITLANIFDGPAEDVALEPGGGIVVIARAAPDSITDRVAGIARLLPNGSLDPSFSADGRAFVNMQPGQQEMAKAVIVLPDGRIVGAGSVSGNGNNACALFCLLPDGSPDPAFGAGGVVKSLGTEYLDLAYQASDQKIVAGGYYRYGFFPTEKDVLLARYFTDGTPDPSFDGDGVLYTDFGWCHANGIALQPDKKIVVAGFHNPGAPFDFLVGRYNENGTLDTGFGPNGFFLSAINGADEELHKVVIQPDGDIVATGYYRGSAGQDDLVLLRLTDSTAIVLPPVTAAFTADPLTGCVPLAVQYTSTSGGNPSSYAWSFPGGQPANSTSPNPLVTYAAPGTYTAMLTVGNGATTDTAIQSNLVQVQSGPTAGFTSAVNGAAVSFTNTSLLADSYSWNFGDGQTGTQSDPQHTFDTSGTYVVTLTAINACGTSTFTQQVVIAVQVLPPAPCFTADPATAGCAPLAVQFSSGCSANADSFFWTFPGGEPSTSSAAAPLVTYSTPGIYAVALTATNAGGSQTVSETGFVSVQAGPTAGFASAVNLATVCFSNVSTNATAFVWDFGDGSGSVDANPCHTYDSTGAYLVELQAVNACDTVTFSQVVNAVVVPEASFSANSTNGCAPLTVQFSNMSTGNPVTFLWLFPGGFPANSADLHPLVTYELPGTYSVTLVAVSGLVSDTLVWADSIRVDGPPLAAFTFAADPAGYAFLNQSVGADSYLWDFGDGQTTTEANPVHVYAEGGTFNVVLTATNACGSTTLPQLLTGSDDPSWLNWFRLFPNPNQGAFTVDISGRPEPAIEFALFNPGGQLIGTQTAGFWDGSIRHSLDFGELPPAIYQLRIRSGAQTAFVKVAVLRL